MNISPNTLTLITADMVPADLMRFLEGSVPKDKQNGHAPPAQAQRTEEDENIELIVKQNFGQTFVADAFAARFKDRLRYVEAWSSFLCYDAASGIWKRDNAQAFELMKRWLQDKSAWANANLGGLNHLKDEQVKRIAARIASGSNLEMLERLSKQHPSLRMQPDQMDANPWHLGTPDGVMDLRAGGSDKNYGRRSPDNLVTKMTTVARSGGCPAWRRFINDVTNGNRELADYLQRLVGYSLTGSTTEHVIAFLIGYGGNGKSTFTKTLQNVLGDYSYSLPMASLLASTFDRIPTDIAGLAGKRFAVASEAQEGRTWNEALIKQISGGDRISARKLYQNFTEFTPSHKLFVVSNHAPNLAAVDDGLRRRLHMIPFVNKFTKPDREMDAKLMAEAKGILQWAYQGCVKYQQEGLKPPAIVLTRTEEYLVSEDNLSLWLEERANLGSGFTASIELFADWESWAKQRGEAPGSMKRFIGRLVAIPGLSRHQPTEGKRLRGVKGLSLKRSAGLPNT